MFKLLALTLTLAAALPAATTFANFTTVNSATNSANIAGTWDVYGNGQLNQTITGTAVVSYSTVTAGSPTNPTIVSGTDNVTHATPGFPTVNFVNAGLTAFGQITSYRSTMYWGNSPTNNTGGSNPNTWTITYNFSSTLPSGVRIVLFDLGVQTTPQPAVNTFTILPTLGGASVNTAGWSAQSYAPAQASGNTETAVFVPGTTQSSFNSIGTPTGNYIFVTTNTALDRIVFTSQSARFNAFSIGFVSDLAAPVPEPGTLGLGACGLIALAVIGRRRLARKA